MRTRIFRFALLSILVLASAAALTAQERRPLKVDDLFALRNVGDPRVSPDGQWVAYTVSQMNEKKDNADTDIYMAPMAGGDAIRLTTSEKPESSPRWSPDGRYLGFLSARDGEKTQVWLLPRGGGEATRLTDLEGGVSSFAWSPDSTRLALVATDPDPDEAEGDEAKKEEKAPKPVVITRLQFKRDTIGYLDNLRDHVYVFDVAAKTAMQVTEGPYDDSSPVWSPDGQSIAFVSNRTKEPDANENSDIFLIAAKPGQTPRALTTSPGTDTSPAFTPDGQFVVYVAGGDVKDMWYATNNVAVVPVAGGAPRVLTAGLDRNVSSPTPTPDGAAVLFGLEDEGSQHLARVPLAGGPVTRVVDGDRDVSRFDVGKQGRDRGARERDGVPVRGLRRAERPARAHHARERRVPLRHRARVRRALQGEEPGRHDDRRLPDAAARRRRRPRSCRPSSASTAARSASSPRPSTSSGRSSPRRATRSSPRTRAARRAAAATSPTRSGPTGATRTSRT